jgi:NAD(P)-dependent dehydrogenase (short-subunit alcohol dehydrogenase family)
MSEGSRPLAGMTAVVTGGAGGIGRATSELLVRDGAHVVIASRTESKLTDHAARLAPLAEESGGSIRHMVCDALNDDQVKALVEMTAEPNGRVDMACGIVGGATGAAPILRFTVDQLEATMRQNITSFFLLLRHAGSAMVRQGGGSIVAISSMQGTQSAPFFGAYCAAKAGLEMFCKVAADELGEFNVRVNCVRPGLTNTDATQGMVHNDEVTDAYLVQQPIGRIGEGYDIGAAVRYFLGPESSWTTGQALTVDGGCSVRRFPDLTSMWEQRGLGDSMAKQAQGIVG